MEHTKLKNIASPIDNYDAATKKYVDDKISSLNDSKDSEDSNKSINKIINENNCPLLFIDSLPLGIRFDLENGNIYVINRSQVYGQIKLVGKTFEKDYLQTPEKIIEKNIFDMFFSVDSNEKRIDSIQLTKETEQLNIIITFLGNDPTDSYFEQVVYYKLVIDVLSPKNLFLLHYAAL